MQLWLLQHLLLPSKCSKWCAVLMQDSFEEDSVLGLSQLAALDALVKLLCSVLVAEVGTPI